MSEEINYLIPWLVFAVPILGAFLLAIGKRDINSNAVIIGMLAGTCLLGVVLYQGMIAWTWYSLIGTAATVTVRYY